jgi:hypothetical protein
MRIPQTIVRITQAQRSGADDGGTRRVAAESCRGASTELGMTYCDELAGRRKSDRSRQSWDATTRISGRP